jgi:hypothetical protein
VLTGWLTHSCNLLKRAKKQKLNYDGGTGAFTKGLIVSGATSKATAVIDKVSGTATGYLILKSVTGTFQTDEVLTDTGTGAAVANGVCSDYQNSYGEYEYYWNTDQSSVPCRFYFSGKDKARIIHETGQLIDQPLSVFLPASTAVTTGEYRIYSSSGAWGGTWDIQTVYPLSNRAAVDHYEAVLKRVL